VVAGGFVALGLTGARSLRDVGLLALVVLVGLPAIVLGVIIARRMPSNPGDGLAPPKVIFQRPTQDLQYLETMAVGADGRLYMGSGDAGNTGAIGTALSGRVLAINR
jgi:hypothetical protein